VSLSCRDYRHTTTCNAFAGKGTRCGLRLGPQLYLTSFFRHFLQCFHGHIPTVSLHVPSLPKCLIDLPRRRAQPSSKQVSQPSRHVPSILSTPHSTCSQRHRTHITLQWSRDEPRACRCCLALALFARYKHSPPAMTPRFTTHLL
jgi:hypothetical protein